jgi:hypothetical protein
MIYKFFFEEMLEKTAATSQSAAYAKMRKLMSIIEAASASAGERRNAKAVYDKLRAQWGTPSKGIPAWWKNLATKVGPAAKETWRQVRTNSAEHPTQIASGLATAGGATVLHVGRKRGKRKRAAFAEEEHRRTAQARNAYAEAMRRSPLYSGG